MAKLFIRLDVAPRARIGPGKIALLEAVAATGSISAAGRALRMSYRRAWMLVEELNRLFAEPVAMTQPGGSQGGGTRLTPFGRDLVDRYRALERSVGDLAREDLSRLEALLAPAEPVSPPPPARPTP